MPTQTREIAFQITTQPGQAVKYQDVSSLVGNITQVVRHWPPGCNGLVDVAVGHEAVWMMPDKTDTFVALDAATPVISLQEPIRNTEKIWVIVRNRDSVFAHTVSVTVLVEGS